MNKSLPATSNLESLYDGFAQHLSAIHSDIKPAACQALWQDIAKRYGETARVYHTLNHIQQLFSQFEQIKHRLEQPHIIALALYYHDVIYDPTRADNEDKSAEHAADKLRKHLSQDPLSTEQCTRIQALIIMTATHKADDSSDSDAAYLLDLSILGSAWPEYERYAQAVRQEYAHVATATYQMGRIAVLEGLLAHPHLYLTDYYYQRLEQHAQHAQHNIKREIKALRAS